MLFVLLVAFHREITLVNNAFTIRIPHRFTITRHDTLACQRVDPEEVRCEELTWGERATSEGQVWEVIRPGRVGRDSLAFHETPELRSVRHTRESRFWMHTSPRTRNFRGESSLRVDQSHDRRSSRGLPVRVRPTRRRTSSDQRPCRRESRLQLHTTAERKEPGSTETQRFLSGNEDDTKTVCHSTTQLEATSENNSSRPGYRSPAPRVRQ